MPDSKWYDSSKDIDELKPILKIRQTDTSQDSMLDNFGASANRIIDDILNKYTEVPVTDVEVTEDLKHAAKMFVCRNYKRLKGNLEGSKEFDAELQGTITKVKEKLIADRTGQTEVVFVTDDDALDRTYQPANMDEYVARVFD